MDNDYIQKPKKDNKMIFFVIGCIILVILAIVSYFILNRYKSDDGNDGKTLDTDGKTLDTDTNENPPSPVKNEPIPKNHDFYGCKMNKIYNNEEGDYIAIEDDVDSEEFITEGHKESKSISCYENSKYFKCEAEKYPVCLPFEINNLDREEILKHFNPGIKRIRNDDFKMDIIDSKTGFTKVVNSDSSGKIFNCINTRNEITGYPSCQNLSYEKSTLDYELDCTLPENYQTYQPCYKCEPNNINTLLDEDKEKCKKTKISVLDVNCNETPNHPICPERCLRGNEYKSQRELDICKSFSTRNTFYTKASEVEFVPEKEIKLPAFDKCELKRVNNENITSGKILFSNERHKDNFNDVFYPPKCIDKEDLFFCDEGLDRKCKPFIANNVKESELNKTDYDFRDLDLQINKANNRLFNCSLGYPTCVKTENNDKIYSLPKKGVLTWSRCKDDTDGILYKKGCHTVVDSLQKLNIQGGGDYSGTLVENEDDNKKFYCATGIAACEKRTFLNCIDKYGTEDSCNYNICKPDYNRTESQTKWCNNNFIDRNVPITFESPIIE